ncbi:hypothetical protein E4U26_001605 [Claviceps purpurea]|nr:hypothetical protein E4U26_001605 [Claviceps purpurea]
MPVFSRSAGDDQTVHRPRYPNRYLGIIWLTAQPLELTYSRTGKWRGSTLIYLNSDEFDYEVGFSESSRGSASVTARFVTIEASPEFAWNDDPQPVRLATRHADLCATVEDADDEDESEPLETIKAVPPSKKKKGMPISEMLDDQLPEAVPLVREKLVEERPRRVRGSNFVVKLIAVEIHQSSQLIEREPDRESMSCHSSKEQLIG